MTQPPGDGGTDPQAAGPANRAPESESPPKEEVQLERLVEKLENYNAQKDLAKVRSRVAYCLIGILAGVLLFGFVLLLTTRLTGVDKIANIGPTYLAVVSNIITLVSAATGFYFGQSQGSSGKDGS